MLHYQRIEEKITMKLDSADDDIQSPIAFQENSFDFEGDGKENQNSISLRESKKTDSSILFSFKVD